MSKILVVDDDITITDLMKMLFMVEGHQPTVVNDSTKALEMARAVNPDLITLDLMMPALTGLEVCALLKADPLLTHIPIVIISAKDDRETKNEAFRLGAKDYIVKPFVVDELLERIKTMMP
jgi:DNA-binding response OmpR family regulator